MQVEFLGHGGFIITSGQMRVACDPWVSPRGAFHTSWFQFPCNHHLWDRDYRHLTALVITHRSEEHTSELQSLRHLVCRLLLEKKNNKKHQRRGHGGQKAPPNDKLVA